MMNDDHHQLLCLWDNPGEAVSSHQLRDAYKQRTNLAKSDDFDSRFRLLISSGLVERAGGGWKLTKRGVKERKRQPELPLKVADRHEQPQMPEPPQPQPGPPRRPDTQTARSTVTIGRRTSREELARPEGEQTVPSSPDCDVFRRLLAYYIDCVRMDERPRTVMYGSDYNRRFISLPISRRWWAKSANEEIEVETHIIESQSQFVRQVAQSQGEELFVGYPLFMRSPKNEDQASLIAPIFCIPASVEQDGLTLKLTLDFADADVNAEWLKYQFKTNDVRRAFLQQCGLLDPWPNDGDGDDSTALEDFLDLESGAVAVRTFCGDKVVGGGIAPEHLRPIGDFEHVESGIHNGAVLYAAKRLRYSAGLLKELRTILNRSSDDDLRRSALRHLFALQAPRSSEETDDAPDDDLKPVPFLQFNHEQEKAVEAALTNGLTVITGPPGTGKSQVGANIIANLAIRGRTAVFASRNHKAIDAVVPRTNNLVQEGTVIHRANNSATGESFTWQDAIRQLLAQPPTPPVAQDEYRRLENDMRRLLDRRGHLLSVAELWTTTERELGQAVEEWDRRTD
ncbi:MAG: AAA family ATPase, partial [Planctomycetes bacterium]|nr:AAA family ATPase [Planctomycetota bacterium]